MDSQSDSDQSNDFNWPLAYAAENLLRQFIFPFLEQNQFARRLAREMEARTGTDFYEWVDHFLLDSEHAGELRAAGLVRETVEAPAGTEVYYHPRAMMPRVLLREAASWRGVPSSLAIRAESLGNFVTAHSLSTDIEGTPGSGLRQVLIS